MSLPVMYEFLVLDEISRREWADLLGLAVTVPVVKVGSDFFWDHFEEIFEIQDTQLVRIIRRELSRRESPLLYA